jgi:hypothetical protein
MATRHSLTGRPEVYIFNAKKLLAGVKYLLDLLHFQRGVLLVKNIGGGGTRMRRGHATCDTNLLAVILTQVVATILQLIEITRERT